jgi:hypothetical protein
MERLVDLGKGNFDVEDGDEENYLQAPLDLETHIGHLG